jgi:triacylglycerol lipase
MKRGGLRLLVGGLIALTSACASSTSSDSTDESKSNLGENEVAPLGPDPAGKQAKYPIVLVHGFKASPEKDGFFGIAEALKADGHAVFVARTPPFQSADKRATYLQQTVDEALATGAPKVNLIAHSMGGLDSRALISTLGYGDRVATLTTISTPHRGSRSIDVIMGFVDSVGAPDEVLDAFGRLWGETFSTDDVAQDTDVRAAFTDLSEKHAPEFNAAHRDDERVSYRSIAGVTNVLGIPNPLDLDACDGKFFKDRNGAPAYPGGGQADVMPTFLGALAAAVSHGLTELRPNDSLVTVESAHWRTFLGCIPANHLQEPGAPGSNVTNQRTGFDPIRFYRNLAFDLAREGF